MDRNVGHVLAYLAVGSLLVACVDAAAQSTALQTQQNSIIDLRGRTSGEIDSLRGALQEHGAIRAEIRSGINDAQPDMLLFEPRPTASPTISVPGTYEWSRARQNKELIERFVSPEEREQLTTSQKLASKRATSVDCGKAIKVAHSGGVTGGNDPEADREAGAGVRKLVETTCMAPLVLTSSNAIDDRAPAWARVQPLANLVGVLYVDSPDGLKPFCTGLFFHRKQVLTARHCFFSPTNGAPLIDMITFAQLGMVHFGLASDAGKTGRVQLHDGQDANSAQFSYLTDLLLLDLEITGVDDPPMVVFRDPIPGDELLIAGVAGDAVPGGQRPTAKALLRYGANADCQALVVAGGCVRHDCQTETSFSGAPAFAEPNEDEIQNHAVRVAGFHLGGASRDACREASMASPGIGELANEGMLASTAASLVAGWSGHQ